MKIKAVCLTVLSASWVLAAGLLLPRAVNHAQDARQADKVEQYETEAAVYERLEVWGFAERLRGAGVSMPQVELKEWDPLEAEAIRTAAWQALEEMEAHDVASIRVKELTETSLTPQVVIAKEENQTMDTSFKTYHAWRCIFVDECGNEMGIMLDSQSQKVIAALYLLREDRDVTQEQAERDARCWAEFCANHYGFTLSDIRQNQVPDGWEFELFFADGLGEKLKLSYAVKNKSVQFQ